MLRDKSPLFQNFCFSFVGKVLIGLVKLDGFVQYRILLLLLFELNINFKDKDVIDERGIKPLS